MKWPSLTKQKKYGIIAALIWITIVITIGGMGTLEFNGVTVDYLQELHGVISGTIRFVFLAILDNLLSLLMFFAIFSALIYFLGGKFINLGYYSCILMLCTMVITYVLSQGSSDLTYLLIMLLSRAFISLILPITIANHLIVKKVKE